MAICRDAPPPLLHKKVVANDTLEMSVFRMSTYLDIAYREGNSQGQVV